MAIAVSFTSCGEDDWENKKRPPAPIEVTARIDPEQVEVSPDRFGAGLVSFTIANLSRAPVNFTLSGPKRAVEPDIEPNTPATMEVDLPQGRYEAAVSANARIQPASVNVGPERPSSQNKLLQP